MRSYDEVREVVDGIGDVLMVALQTKYPKKYPAGYIAQPTVTIRRMVLKAV